MFMVLTLIVLVAAFNIVSTLIMGVLDKREEIAILKALGATAGHIRRIFILEGLMIGLLGTTLGAILGLAGCAALAYGKFIELPSDVFYNFTLPVRIDWGDVALVLCAAIAIAVVATLYPARQAGRFAPAQALRRS